jgi:hypothetical protein
MSILSVQVNAPDHPEQDGGGCPPRHHIIGQPAEGRPRLGKLQVSDSWLPSQATDPLRQSSCGRRTALSSSDRLAA